MTKYYKSRNVDNPVVYVQEEGQWRGYAPRGVLQRSTGRIPAVILAQTVEISQDQAETLMRIMRAETAGGTVPQAAAADTVPQAAAADTVPQAAAEGTGPQAAEAEVTSVPSQGSEDIESSNPRSRRPGRLPYVLMGSVAVVVVVVVVVLATTGVFGGGSRAPGTQAGATAGTGAPGALQAEILATVGGRSITKEQFDQRVADFEAERAGRIPDKKSAPDQYKLFQQDVLEYMITYDLARREAERLNLAVTDQDVQTQIDTILKVSFGGDQAKFDDALKQEGITMDQLKQSYRESTLLQKVYAEVTKDVAAAMKTEAWKEWIDHAKAEAGVTYAEGWKPTATTGTALP